MSAAGATFAAAMTLGLSIPFGQLASVALFAGSLALSGYEQIQHADRYQGPTEQYLEDAGFDPDDKGAYPAGRERQGKRWSTRSFERNPARPDLAHDLAAALRRRGEEEQAAKVIRRHQEAHLVAMEREPGLAGQTSMLRLPP